MAIQFDNSLEFIKLSEVSVVTVPNAVLDIELMDWIKMLSIFKDNTAVNRAALEAYAKLSDFNLKSVYDAALLCPNIKM